MGQLDLQTVVYREGEHYIAQCLDIHLSSFGADKQDALANLGEAVELYLEDASVPELELTRAEGVEVRTLHVQRAQALLLRRGHRCAPAERLHLRLPTR